MLVLLEFPYTNPWGHQLGEYIVSFLGEQPDRPVVVPRAAWYAAPAQPPATATEGPDGGALPHAAPARQDAEKRG